MDIIDTFLKDFELGSKIYLVNKFNISKNGLNNKLNEYSIIFGDKDYINNKQMETSKLILNNVMKYLKESYNAICIKISDNELDTYEPLFYKTNVIDFNDCYYDERTKYTLYNPKNYFIDFAKKYNAKSIYSDLSHIDEAFRLNLDYIGINNDIIPTSILNKYSHECDIKITNDNVKYDLIFNDNIGLLKEKGIMILEQPIVNKNINKNIKLLGKIDKYYVYEKTKIDEDYPVKIDLVNCKGKHIFVVRDDIIIGGSKQRAWRMLNRIKESEIVYGGPYNGFAQVALAVGAKLTNKRFTMFLSKGDHKISYRSRMYGANIQIYKDYPLKDLQRVAEEYAKKNGAYLIPFGLDDEIFKEELYKSIRTNWDEKFKPKRIWVVAGYATLLRVLYKIFPTNVFFNVVQVGRTVWKDLLDESRTKLYIAPQKFFDDIDEIPPYPTVLSYDGKVWQFVEKYGQDGDYIWNVATENDIDDGMIYNKLNKEYERYILINEITVNQSYEMKNIIERWLLESANLALKKYDYVFAENIINNMTHFVNKLFIMEYVNKKIGNIKDANSFLTNMIDKIKSFINKKPINNLAKIIIGDNYIQYDKHKRNINKNRLKKLLIQGGEDNVVIMSLRYESILSTSQHWNMPLKNYERYYKQYNIRIEGFASPLNSQLYMIANDIYFCSVFEDTDKYFGSIGSFFDADLQNKNVSVGPPYTVDILNKVALKCVQECDKATILKNKILLLITFVAWKDTFAYESLSNSKYLIYKTQLDKDKHYYENYRENGKQVIARFNTVLFVLSVNNNELNFKNALNDMIVKV